ncbi:MAG TPA: TadE/TadG family type IV pilus assembly protein [Pyrinomonadaceae bacterium]|nr:TadE/TadG family type IV pilus assembly protein [Pyrinomonadaceae bacterium]
MRATLKLTCGRLRRLAGDERGTQLVELALVLPVLIALFAATAEFGRYFYSYSTLAKATRAGARYLTTTPVKTVTAGEGVNAVEDAKVKRLVVYGDANASDGSKPLLPGLAVSHVDIDRQGGTATVPDTVTVRIVGYKYTPLVNLGNFANALPWTSPPLKSSTTMRFLLTQPSS